MLFRQSFAEVAHLDGESVEFLFGALDVGMKFFVQRLVLIGDVGKLVHEVQVRLILVGESVNELVEAGFVKSKILFMVFKYLLDWSSVTICL